MSAALASRARPRRAPAPSRFAARRRAAADPFTSGVLGARRRVFERYLSSAVRTSGGSARRLDAAMRYAALSPGKRLRPLLVLAAAQAVGGEWRRALPAAAAIECVHAFSLVHDDLPAMDDDDYRRGRLTTHKRFGEALGVLAGDGLLAFAFEELTRLRARGVSAAGVVEAVRRLARASGAARLVGGQALDIAAEGRRVSIRDVRTIHWHKTGGLMGAALALGAIAGGAPPQIIAELEDAGRFLGLTFQIQDDLLNSRSTLRRLGKRAGTDRARGKATFLKVSSESETRAAVPVFFDLVRASIRNHCPRPRPILALIDAVEARER